jgi:hypothetical protein
MAWLAEDAAAGLSTLKDAVSAKGGELILSDCKRSWDMQWQAHMDYVNNKKSAYSPAPGASFHEAGRAIDLDLKSLRMALADFWDLAIPIGWCSIIAKPDSSAKEAWHFEFRGVFQKVRDLYGYSQAAKAAICDVGDRVDENDDNNLICHIQWGLLRLGSDLGSPPIDGSLGPKTKSALSQFCLSHFPNAAFDPDLASVGQALKSIEGFNL